MTTPTRTLLPLVTACAALALACAEAHPALEPTTVAIAATPPPTAAPAQQRRPFNAGAWVAMQDLARDCEQAAGSIRRDNADEGWQALRACVEKGKFVRGSKFVELAPVVNNWASELGSRPEAPTMLAQLIANRGGDIDGDLSEVQKARAPLFTLAAAMSQPAVYKGRLLLVRAQLRDVNADAPAAGGPASPGVTVVLDESAFMSVHQFREDQKKSGTSWRSGKSYNDKVTAIDNHNNVSRLTGRGVLGRMPESDPFLQPGKDFVFLARFDGLTKDEARSLAVVTILKYYSPSALMLQ